MLGFDERYTKKKTDLGTIGVNDHPEMGNDVLTTSSSQQNINPIHIQDIVNFAKKNGSGTYSLFSQEGFKIDNTEQGNVPTSADKVKDAKSKTSKIK